jgi:5'(3')-deoxyribonucleotidase
MTIETIKFDLVYGQLLKIGINIDTAKVMAKTLLDISHTIGVNVDDLLKQIDQNGMRFENDVYKQLNLARTNSSQLGYLDASNIPPAITRQVV